MIIDIFCHFISASIGETIEKAMRPPGEKPSGRSWGQRFPYPVQNADPEVRLNLMNKYCIDIQAVSQTTGALLGVNAETAAEICKLSNDDNYALCKAYPDRFVNICMISLLDVKSAMEELDRSINDLDCRGVTISTNQNGKGLDSPEYFPFYEKIVQHDLPLLLHPVHWESYPLVKEDTGWAMMSVFGWPFDTSQAVWRLIFGGVIDRFPSLKIVMHHLGAMFPYFIGRVETTFNRLKDKLPRHISEYYGNLYGDTALSGGHPSAFVCGHAFFGSDRMLFGTDYPYGPEGGERFIRENLKGVMSLDLPSEEKDKILCGNTKRLLKI